jgi:hypothetical protein
MNIKTTTAIEHIERAINLLEEVNRSRDASPLTYAAHSKLIDARCSLIQIERAKYTLSPNEMGSFS